MTGRTLVFPPWFEDRRAEMMAGLETANFDGLRRAFKSTLAPPRGLLQLPAAADEAYNRSVREVTMSNP